VRTNFSADFGLFAIFDRNFAKIVSPPNYNDQNYLLHFKGQSMLKKHCKQHRATLYEKVEIFDILGAAFPPPETIEVKFCTAKRTHVPVGPANF